MLRNTDVRLNNLDFSWPRISAGLTDILFAPGRSLWAGLETIWVAALFVIGSWGSPYQVWGQHETSLLVLAISFAVSFVLFSLGLGQYERVRRFSVTKIFLNTLLATFFSLMFSLFLTYFLTYGVFGRLNLLWAAASAFLGVLLLRLGLALVFRLFPYRFTVLGESELTSAIVSFVSDSRHREASYFKYIEVPNINEELPEFWEFFSHMRIQDIIVSQTYLENHAGNHLVLNALERGFRLMHEEHFYTDFFECSPLQRLTPSTLVSTDLSVRKLAYEFIKRLIDIICSASGLILLSPLMLMIAIAIKVTSSGEVIFTQPRQGRYRKPFSMYKFRTMKTEESCPNASKGFTRANDVRVTALGRLLRPLHLDELPQLWNILRGDMSLVGPRPEALYFAKKMTEAVPLYDLRYTARPGLSGHAQLLAGYLLDSVEDTKTKLSYDLYYLRNQSILLDLRIILRTIFVVLKKLMV